MNKCKHTELEFYKRYDGLEEPMLVNGVWTSIVEDYRCKKCKNIMLTKLAVV